MVQFTAQRGEVTKRLKGRCMDLPEKEKIDQICGWTGKEWGWEWSGRDQVWEGSDRWSTQRNYWNWKLIWSGVETWCSDNFLDSESEHFPDSHTRILVAKLGCISFELFTKVSFGDAQTAQAYVVDRGLLSANCW